MDFNVRLLDDGRPWPEVFNIPVMPMQQLRTRAEEGHPDAQFLLSQVCLQSGDFDGMMHWLQQAVASDIPDALSALGRCHEKGQGTPRDFVAAMTQYDRAIDLG